MVEKRNKSKYEPGNIIWLDEPPDHPDRITLGGVKPIGVTQVGDKGEELGFATVQTSRGLITRQPFLTDEAKAVRRERRYGTTVIPGVKGYKWCSQCGEWVEVKGFSKKDDASDKLHPHCKECRAAHSRLMYWHQKNTAIAA